MTTDKAIEVANKMQLSNNPLWLEVKRLACVYEKQIADLEAQIKKMGCCMKCEHWYYYKSFCDKDNSYHAESDSCENFKLRRQKKNDRKEKTVDA